MNSFHRLFVSFVVLFDLLFLSACVSSDMGQMTEFTGIVRDGLTQEPVSGATVQVYDQPSAFASFPPGIRKPVLLAVTNSVDGGAFRIIFHDGRRVRLIANSPDGNLWGASSENPPKGQQVVLELRPL